MAHSADRRTTGPAGASLFALVPNETVWNLDQPGGGRAFLASAGRRLHPAGRGDGQAGANAQAGRRGAMRSGLRAAAGVRIIDEVAPSDTMLVALDDAQRIGLQRAEPDLRVVPVRRLAPLWLQRERLASPLSLPRAGPRRTLEVRVVDGETGRPLGGIDVIALTDRERRTGFSQVTNARGLARLLVPANLARFDSIEALAPVGYWPACVEDQALAPAGDSNTTVRLACTPIDPGFIDVRQHFDLVGRSGEQDGEGLRVAVIDTGVARHRDLRLAAATNVVKGERALGDDLGHGTHVASVIAGRAARGKGIRGVAPGVDLHAYRVFAKGADRALSFNIAKAIRLATDAGCDLINLSLGDPADMPDVLREIQRAAALGVVCLAAAGNDYRGAVSYPARYSVVLAVSALGRRGTWPAGAAQVLDSQAPFGRDRRIFIAAFSNIGSEIQLTGPGVGIISTFPGHGRDKATGGGRSAGTALAVMDGTSMACPAATGALARLLSREKRVVAMDRNQRRADAIIRLALSSAADQGFAARYEGAGLLL